jgi:hypothetical protein
MKNLNLRWTFILLATVIMSTGFSSVAVAQQDEERGIMVIVHELHVKNGHTSEFHRSVAEWKECYLRHNGTDQWDLWQRFQGKGNVYYFTSAMENFAAFDQVDEAGRNCYEVITEKIEPTLENRITYLTRLMPAISKPFEGFDVAWVTFWSVSDGQKFTEIRRKLSEAVTEAEGSPRAYWYNIMGGEPDGPRALLVTPYQNFAALDNPTGDGVWTIAERAFGKKESDKMREEWRNSFRSVSSYMVRRIPDLSSVADN